MIAKCLWRPDFNPSIFDKNVEQQNNILFSKNDEWITIFEVSNETEAEIEEGHKAYYYYINNKLYDTYITNELGLLDLLENNKIKQLSIWEDFL